MRAFRRAFLGFTAAAIIGGCVVPVRAQDLDPTGGVAKPRIDRAVGEMLHPGRIFLDVAWARSAAAPGEKDRLVREAFVAAQMAQRSLSGSSISQMVARLAEGEDAFAVALRHRQETFEEVEALRGRLADAARQDDAARLRTHSTVLQSAIARLADQDEQLLRKYPNYANIVQQQPLALDEVRAQLQPGEALIYVADGDKGLYVFTVTAEGATWHRSPLTSRELEKEISSLRCQLEIPACGGEGAARSYDRGKAYRVYAAIFAPAAAQLSDKMSLIVIANRTLSRFPVAALVTEETDPRLDGDAADLRRPNWLIDRFAVTMIPSPSALLHLRSLPIPARGARSFRGFGNPALDEPSAEAQQRRRRLAADRFAALSTGILAMNTGELKDLFDDLPYTAAELEALRRALAAPPQTVTLGPPATESAVRTANLRDVSILAFATHGVLGGEVPWIFEPALIFTPPALPSPSDDGVLTASEAAKLQLGADLVILSACNTAGPSGYEGPASEGMAGLARAFFFAGARSLLVSHWRVFDDVASELTVRTIKELSAARPADKATALQRAIISVRGQRKNDWSHPSAWAPFVLVGDSR